MALKESKLNNWDLWKFCKNTARFDMSNYDRDGYRIDNNDRKKARIQASKAAGIYWQKSNFPIYQGEYFSSRLIITEDKIEYHAGQYAPTEIYWALRDYYKTVREL